MAEEKSQEADNSDGPKKCRWPMWKVLLISFGVFVLVLFVVWLAANIAMDRRIKAQFAEYRDAGQPTKIEEFWSPEIPDEENAAIPLRLASDSLVLDDDQRKVLESKLHYAFVRDNPKTIEEILSKNAASIAYIDSARTRNKFSLNLKPADIWSYTEYDIYDFLSLAKFSALRGIDLATKGDGLASTECIMDIDRCVKSAADYKCILWCGIFTDVDHVGVLALEEILPHLALPTSQEDGGKLSSMLDAIKTMCLDDEFYFEHVNVAFCFDKLFFGSLPDGFHYCGPSPEKTFWQCVDGVREPLLKKTFLDIARLMEQRRLATMTRNYPAAAKILATAKLPHDPISSTMHFLSGWADADSWLDYDAKVYLFYYSLALRHMAAVAIAMKQYEWDNGSRPAKLADLVPKYLAAVPVDPYSASGEPIKLGAWGGRRLLYSIGMNGVDEGGQYAAAPNDKVDKEKYDIPFFLNGDRPDPSATLSPATSPTSRP